MKRDIPDYFIALVKQHAGIINNDQAIRVIHAASKAVDASLEPPHAQKFFSLAPSYLRPAKHTFFAKIGDWSKPVSSKTAVEQVASRLQLTDAVEARMLVRAYFGAVQTVVDQKTQFDISMTLSPELSSLFFEAKAHSNT